MPTNREIEAAISALMKLNSYLAPHNMCAALEAAERERMKDRLSLEQRDFVERWERQTLIKTTVHTTAEPVTRKG